MSEPPPIGQPAVRRNDWRTLAVPELGNWSPKLSVAVVMPAHQPARLNFSLAALAAQSYPPDLLEVVVVDDGSTPRVVLPEIRPDNTRIARVLKGWGRANACHQGALASDADVLHWLDADMVVHRDHVEAQLRWHHQVDYGVVLGHKLFVDESALDELTAAALREAIGGGALEELAVGEAQTHGWLEEVLGLTRDLCDAGPRAMRAHVGATASVRRSVYFDSGGMDVELALGEDIVLGYRLREVGAVFIPDREARSLHLGRSTVMGQGPAVNRYNRPHIADRVPEFRGHRVRYMRSYSVPYVEAVVQVGSASHESVRALVDALFTGTVPDLVVTLVAQWERLHAERRAVLQDPDLELRLIRATFQSEPRVRWAHELDTSTKCEATFRLVLGSVGCFPSGDALERLLARMEHEHQGLIRVATEDAAEIRLERTAALERARRVAGPDAVHDDVIERVYGVATTTSQEAGFVTPATAPVIKHVRGLVPWGLTRR